MKLSQLKIDLEREAHETNPIDTALSYSRDAILKNPTQTAKALMETTKRQENAKLDILDCEREMETINIAVLQLLEKLN